MVPTKIQLAIQKLQPIQLSYSRKKSQWESAFNLVALLSMLAIPYLVLVYPLSMRMLEVKREMCYGLQNFVVAYNADVGMAYGLLTTKRNASDPTLAEVAVQSYKFAHPTPWTQDAPPPAPKYFQLGLATQEFETGRIRKMAEEAAYFPVCWETDVLNGGGSNDTGLWTIAQSRMRAAAFHLDREDATTCAELRDYCYLPESRLLRLMCGDTCGCTDPMSVPWYKQKAEGCAEMCLSERRTRLRALPCQDFPQAGAATAWNEFWDNYAAAITAYFGEDRIQYANSSISLAQTMKAGGCAALQANPIDAITGESYCFGAADLFGPLAYLCPESCGCRTYSAENQAWYCPQSCSR
ncbi:unnamed protein product [Symbiodinium pilosum]|uniref:Uncharacterized protein n=1 Tax=Symbiodinium pilosum TaxID=2952 RepID=A0A812XLJ9_SYMPI|nr:unnamed protein product [Symbiodinium pilosum]